MLFQENKFQTQFNDFQTAENALAQAKRKGLAPQMLKMFVDMVTTLGFERRAEAARKENKQHVLQGQLLVLGDSRKGKTSLIKAMTGGEFDPEENQTSGVEFKFVDQKWNTLELKNLKFGDFSQYSEKIEERQENLVPRLFTFNERFKVGFIIKMGFFVILSIFLGMCFGESYSRWFMYIPFMALLFFEGNVHILLAVHFECLATCIAYKLFGCSDKSVVIRFCSFVNELVTFDIIPVYSTNRLILFFLEWFFLFCTCHTFCILFSKLLPSGITVREVNGVHHSIWQFSISLVFFAPISLSCNYSYIIFPFKCVYIFLMHIELLYRQNILGKKNMTALIAVELSIIIPLCFTGLEKVHIVLKIIANIILLTLGLGLHIYGIVKDDFKEKPFTLTELVKYFRFHTIQIKKAFINEQKLKNALNDKFCTLKLKILDFAGDEEYYAYHQIFLNSNALYVVVFNIQDYVNNDFKDPDCKLSKRLRFWLESIHSHVPQGTPIFLVGTHRADIPVETLRVINSCIREGVLHPFSDEIFLNEKDDLLFFPVENSRGTADKGILNLCQKIKSVAEEEFKNVIGQEIPWSWIQVQDAIIKYQKSQQGPACATVEDFKKKAIRFYIAWDNEILKYFHKKGFVVYVDKDQRSKSKGLSNWVLLKPDVLVQIVILLINQPREVTNKRGYRKHWTLLQKSGMITKTLLHFILSQAGEQETEQSSLIAFLEEYDLLCPLKHPLGNMQNTPAIRQTTHFVPSLLPMSESQPVWNESSEDIKFYIFFDKFLPQGLFYRLLSRACKLSYDVMKSYEPVIYRDSGVFWLSKKQPYCLKLLKNEGLIEVIFSKTTDGMKPFDVLSLIATSMVESICKRDFCNLSFHCGPECTSIICPGSPSDSVSLFTGQQRRHVFSIFQYPERRFWDSFKCLNFLQDAGIWNQ